jgi:hypothetical protein
MTRSRTSLALGLVALSFCAPHLKAEEEPAAATEGPVLVASKPPEPTAKKYELKYKLKRGEVLRYEVEHRASIRSTIEETTQAAQTKTDSVKVWKVNDVLPNGDVEFTNVVESVKMVNQLPDKDPIEYDSTRDKTPPPGFESAAKAVGVPLSVMRITPEGKIVRRTLKIKGQGAEEDAPIVLRLPEEPVAIGDTWDEPFEVQASVEENNTKAIQTRRHHKLVKVESNIAKIQVTYQVLTPIDSQIEVQLVQRLMEGEVQFDIETGRVLGQQMDIDKRILGFAGPTSSLQYIMRMEEKLAKAPAKATVKNNSRSKSSKPTASSQRSKQKPRSASRPPRATSTGPGGKPIRR